MKLSEIGNIIKLTTEPMEKDARYGYAYAAGYLEALLTEAICDLPSYKRDRMLREIKLTAKELAARND